MHTLRLNEKWLFGFTIYINLAAILLCFQLMADSHENPDITSETRVREKSEQPEFGSYLESCGKKQQLWYQTKRERNPIDLSPTAKAAAEVLKNKCAGCHYPGSTTGATSFKDILSIESINDYIEPGNAANSHLYSVVLNGSMPKGTEKLSLDELSAIEKWINSGAQKLRADEPLGRPRIDFISEQDKEKCILNDLIELPNIQQINTRYLTLTHLYNAGRYNDLETVSKAVSKLINSLSNSQNIFVPEPIDETGTIFRIDLAKLGLTASQWDSISKFNPYGLRALPAVASQLTSRTRSSTLPHVRGDWFVFAASQGDLYYDLMNIPSENVVIRSEKQPRKNVDLLIAKQFSGIQNQQYLKDHGQSKRWGIRQSNVSQFNRVLDRYDSPYGAHWISSDFKSNDDTSNIYQHPVDFTRAGGEIIFSKKNGLHGYALVKAQGERLSEGPLDIVSHPENKRNQFKVINAYSCMGCHDEGLKTPKDTLREHVVNNQADLIRRFGNQSISNLLKSLPESPEESEWVIQADKQVYRKALEATGNSMGKDTVFPTVLAFQEDLDERSMAAELGFNVEELRQAIEKNRELKLLLALDSTRRLDRESFNRIFGEAIRRLNRGEFIPPQVVARIANVAPPPPAQKVNPPNLKKAAVPPVPKQPPKIATQQLPIKPYIPPAPAAFKPSYPMKLRESATKGGGTGSINIQNVKLNPRGEISAITIQYENNPKYLVSLNAAGGSAGAYVFKGKGSIQVSGPSGATIQYSSEEEITLNSLNLESLKSFNHKAKSVQSGTKVIMSHTSKGYKDYLSPGVPTVVPLSPETKVKESIHSY